MMESAGNGLLKKAAGMKWIMTFLVFVMLSACSVKLLVPAQEDVARVSVKYPGYSLGELNEGKELFVTHCGDCHRLKRPTSKTEEQWHKIVPKMVKRANKKTEKIDARSEELILKYLVTMSGNPTKP